MLSWALIVPTPLLLQYSRGPSADKLKNEDDRPGPLMPSTCLQLASDSWGLWRAGEALKSQGRLISAMTELPYRPIPLLLRTSSEGHSRGPSMV